MEFYETLNWTVEGLKKEGLERDIELISIDTSRIPIQNASRSLLNNPDIKVIIGPATSDETFLIAPDCIRAKKLLITPSATSGDISRMYNKYKYIWRTTAGDRIQIRLIINLLKERNVTRAALLYENNTYGQTFYDWVGYYAIEAGINITSLVPFSHGENLSYSVRLVCQGDPEYVIIAAKGSDAASISHIVQEEQYPVTLFCTDSARSETFPLLAGKDAEGIEGICPTADKSTGFFVSYQEEFHKMPPDYAAHTRDALFLALSVLARMETFPFESPDQAMQKILSGTDGQTTWDDQGIIRALQKIHTGKCPDLTGASGSLNYDLEQGIDPTETWYVIWRIENGTFLPIRYIPGSFESRSTIKDIQSFKNQTGYQYNPSSGDFKAIIVATSDEWDNYRHQADAAYVYQLLHENGVTDDDIFLITPEDIPVSPQNPIPGDLHHVVSGENIYIPGTSDINQTKVTSNQFISLLLGINQDTGKPALISDENTTLLIYIVGHAKQDFLKFPDDDYLSRSDFQNALRILANQNRFRHLLIIVDSCFGESFGKGLNIPGIIFFTGASAEETSKGTEFDLLIRQWLSDDFTMSFTSVLQNTPNLTLRELYEKTYDRVSGSHVRIMTGNESDLDLPAMEFFSP